MDFDPAVSFIWFLAFLFSTTVHEAMHALVAWKGGDSTAYQGGQVSLAPLPHIRREPIGMLVVPLLTAFTQGWVMGWASAPYDPVWAERHPQRAALMAAAGPAGNVLVALVAFAGLKAGLLSGYFTSPDHASLDTLVSLSSGDGAGFVGTALSIFLVLNVFLGAFNLLPLPPLDGSAVITVFLPDRAADWLRGMQANGAMSMLGLMVAWQIFPLMVDPLFMLILRMLHRGVEYS